MTPNLVGDNKLRQDSFYPSLLGRRRRIDRARLVELESQRRSAVEQLAALETEVQNPGREGIDLLEELPIYP